jgi:uncharacterized cupredoxin-like copper-binding protein
MQGYRWMIAAAAAATTVAGCSAKDAATDTSAVAQAGAAGAATTAASQASFDPTTHVAVIHAKDYAFDAPDSISAGVTTIRVVNDGPGLHHVQLVRLDSAKTAADLEAALKNPGPPPRWAVFVGGPNAPDPHGTSEATLDLTAGNYVLLCMVDMPEHMPHFARGMAKALTVAPASGTPATMPAADATVRLADYNFTVSGAMNAGHHTVKVQNDGPQLHEVELVRLAPGKTAADVMAWIANPQGPPPGNALGGMTALAPGMSADVSVDLTPGKYAFLCFLPDAKDGNPHTAHGMFKEFSVE